MRLYLGRIIATALLCASCATVENKGILVNTEPGTPVDESDLKMHCDLGDDAACFLSGEHKELPPTRFPILQGIAPPDQAVFAARVPRDSNLSWFLYDRELSKLTKLQIVKAFSRGKSTHALQRLNVRGLVPERNYELLVGDTNGRLLELRNFRTLSADAKSVRAMFIGGLRFASAEKATQIHTDLVNAHPQLVIFSGGNVLGTLSKEQTNRKEVNEFLFEKHAAARASLPLAMDRDLIPAGALWNDDEFGALNGNRLFAYRDQSRENLELFFPYYADEENVIDGPGLSKSFVLGQRLILLVDDLSFRTPDATATTVCEKKKGKKVPVCKTTPPTAPTLENRFGKIQVSWLQHQKEKSDKPAWMVGASPLALSLEGDWAEKQGPVNTMGEQPWEAFLEAASSGDLSIKGPTAVR